MSSQLFKIHHETIFIWANSMSVTFLISVADLTTQTMIPGFTEKAKHNLCHINVF